jgi:hypothetical protein
MTNPAEPEALAGDLHRIWAWVELNYRPHAYQLVVDQDGGAVPNRPVRGLRLDPCGPPGTPKLPALTSSQESSSLAAGRS